MNTNSDLVTVIIPAYNHERYVQKAVESIINQTYENLELIVVDDGSSDGTWNKICELNAACKKRFKKLIVRKQENQGTLKTLKDTLHEASGKYIYYIASDDIAHPDAIKKLHDNIGDAALIFSDLALIDENGRRFYLTGRNWAKRTYDVSKSKYKTHQEAFINKKFPDMDQPDFDWYKNLLRGCCVNIGFLVSKEALMKIKAYNNRELLIEDYSMYLQLSKFYKIKRLKDVLFYYRRHTHNISARNEYMYTGEYHIFMNEKEFCYNNGYRVEWDKNFLKRFGKTLSKIQKLKFWISAYIYRIFGI